MGTPNRGIDTVPENTTNPAAGLNIALGQIDAQILPAVISMALSAPPGSPANGDLYIVGGSASGAWAGKENQLAQYVSAGTFWKFYAAARVYAVLNKDDGGLYSWDFASAWQPAIPGSGGADPVTSVTSASGVANIDCDLGELFKITLTENITSLTFSNLPGSGNGKTVMLQITQHASAAKTFAWPASFKWAGGAAPSISTGASAVDMLAITTFDNGTTWRATLAKAFA